MTDPKLIRKITIEEFKEAVRKKGITQWIIYRCILCGYPCGYRFSGEEVFYDSGCDCVPYPSSLSVRSWQDAVDHVNSQIDWLNDERNDRPDLTMETIKKDIQFFGFENYQTKPGREKINAV